MPAPSLNIVTTINGTIVGSLLVDATGDIYGEATGYQGLGNVVFAVAAGTHNVTTTAGFDYATNGASFTGGLATDGAGTLYGATQYGGTNADSAGTVFAIDPTTLAITTLASASSAFSPGSTPIVDAAGNILYAHLGSNSAIEELASGSPTLTTFLSTDVHSSLIMDEAGNLYGAAGIGADGRGAIFEIVAGTTTVTDLVDFDYANGNGLVGNLVMDAAGNIYGNASNLFEIAAGTHAFSVRANFSDGGTSETNQIAVDAAGNIFGTTTTGTGSVYELQAGSSTITTLLDNADGLGGLVTGADGKIYGASANTIEEVAPCFCTGTLIATDQGDRPIESLQIGDRVVTLDGTHHPIRWIGRRSYAGAFVAGHHLMLPICVTADTLGPGVPSQDLFVSPGHSLFVEGHLIPAWRLINEISIVQAYAVEELTYINIELDRHNIILANGTPTESFLDDHCRNQFENAAEFHALYPDSAPPIGYAPRLEEGFELQRIQRLIAARAHIAPPKPHEPGPLQGQIDVIEPGRICGWAQDAFYPEEPVSLAITIGEAAIGPILANRYRADLRKARLGSGCHSFEIAFPMALTGPVAVQRVSDGALLWNGSADHSAIAA